MLRKGKSRSLTMITAATVMLAAGSPAQADEITWNATHTFSIVDVQGDFEGTTVAQDVSILCGYPDLNSPACPTDDDQPQVFTDKEGITLYPVDSAFGYYVEDYVGAAEKVRGDGFWTEGFAGNVYANGELVGLRVSNAPTDEFKVRFPEGTWCRGLGGNTVKCSTEHYSVLEHVLTCHEQVPYFYAEDPLAGIQRPLRDPATGEILLGEDGEPLTCADAQLDNMLFVKSGGVISDVLLADVWPLPANESTVLDDIAVSGDYAVTFKDDGKALYRWGTIVKRPNDMRMYAKLDLPDEWKANPEVAYPVLSAKLIVHHLITNNPNDQLRPEDMENESATGRTPVYNVLGDYRQSTSDCYEGDGDFIPSGTLYRNGVDFRDGINDPLPISADLVDDLGDYSGMTNAWYTTIQRDPFEPTDPDDPGATGPRWRLKANKFGQDIPGLEIPTIECSPVPFTHDALKYPVGEFTEVVINLLDWDGPDGPLNTSQGWINATANIQNILADGAVIDENGNGVTINGLPMSTDFDLAVYIKGDQKPTTIFDAELVIVYEGEGGGGVEPPVDNLDLGIASLRVPSKVKLLQNKKLRIEVSNFATVPAGGTLTLQGFQGGIALDGATFSAAVPTLLAGETRAYTFVWQASPTGQVDWIATVTAAGDNNDLNDTAAATTIVK
ncbi:MAG: DUF11 domain-containing protein [Gammaproteobacteria bacterium]|nr:DUF11 domain-containing protein [Gammaproteobacteria bacterium]